MSGLASSPGVAASRKASQMLSQAPPPLSLVLAGPSHQGHQGWQVPAQALDNEALEFKPAGTSEGVYGKSKGGNRRAGTETRVATLTGHPAGHSTSPNRIYPLICHPIGHNLSPIILSGSLMMLKLLWGCFVFSLRKTGVKDQTLDSVLEASSLPGPHLRVVWLRAISDKPALFFHYMYPGSCRITLLGSPKGKAMCTQLSLLCSLHAPHHRNCDDVIVPNRTDAVWSCAESPEISPPR